MQVIRSSQWVAFAGQLPGIFAALALAWPNSSPAQSVPSQPYIWRNVVMGAGGFVDGLVFHPTAKDLLYARTDVGGAYRWDAAAGQWVALTDWLSPGQNNYTGIESIGLDPADPNRVYLAAGTYSGSPAAILRSDDQGKSFEVSVVPFHMGGNEDGRSNGERLAVDPNDGTILFFGSRREGLWQSRDRAVTWQVVTSFPDATEAPTPPVTPPAAVPGNGAATNTPARPRRTGGFFGGNPSVGIVSVVFDPASGHPGAATPVIYAAVSTTGTNLFRSTDAGATWQPVPGQPVGLRPSHLIRSADGRYYLTYGSAPGPNNVNDGALWKYISQDGAWTDITPEKPADGRLLGWGYGAVAVDAQHPATLVATTMDRWGPKDEVFRSTDGGVTWKGILVANGALDYSLAPYTAHGYVPHWLGTVAVNPHNSDQILFGTGYGIWCSTNATAADAGGKVTWIFQDRGLEETVPLAMVSPPTGAHLISGVGDIDGFRHDEVDFSPPQGTFAGRRFSSTRDIVYAGAQPEIMVRSGNGGGGGAQPAISTDGGSHWQTLAGDAQGGNGRGRLALSANGAVILHGASFTRDRGTTWTACQGLPNDARVVADMVNPLRFYAFDGRAGTLLVSTDGGARFSATAAVLPASLGGGRGGNGGGLLTATTGVEGDLWLGSRTAGLVHSADGGVSFTNVPAVTSTEALGFGKAAPGKTFPAVFLLGSLGSQYGRFRSDDAGRTWVRIDDPRHQYGAANVPMIIGDPRVYGRVYITTGGRGILYGDLNPDVK